MDKCCLDKCYSDSWLTESGCSRECLCKILASQHVQKKLKSWWWWGGVGCWWWSRPVLGFSFSQAEQFFESISKIKGTRWDGWGSGQVSALHCKLLQLILLFILNNIVLWSGMGHKKEEKCNFVLQRQKQVLCASKQNIRLFNLKTNNATIPSMVNGECFGSCYSAVL